MKRRGNLGVSMIEVLVVASILAILASVGVARAMPADANGDSIITRAGEVACKMNLRIVQNATEMFAVLEGRYPVSPAELYPRYLDRIPQCPVTGQGYVYDEFHIVRCKGGH